MRGSIDYYMEKEALVEGGHPGGSEQERILCTKSRGRCLQRGKNVGVTKSFPVKKGGRAGEGMYFERK